MIRAGTFSEARYFGAGYAIICDFKGCHRQIDYLSQPFWKARVEKGLIYSGRVTCHRHRKEDREQEEA